MAKKQISIRIDEDIYNSIVSFAESNNTTIIKVIEDACVDYMHPNITLRGYLIKALNEYNKLFPAERIVSKAREKKEVITI